MTKIYFRYGTMDSSKSMNLIASVHNYKSKGDDVIVFKPSVDTRSQSGFVESRTGIRTECIDLSAEDSISEHMREALMEGRIISCVFIDEVQFLTNKQMVELLPIADNLRIPVIAYGLKTDFRGILFPASEFLFRHADKVEEIKTICHETGCNRKALYNQRLSNGTPVFSGDSVVIGDTGNKEEISYAPKCRFHYMKDFFDNQTNTKAGR